MSIVFTKNIKYQFLNINLMFKIKIKKKQPVLNIVVKITTVLIVILLKSFTKLTLYLNLISQKHSISKAIITMFSTSLMFSPFLLYQIVRNLTLNLFSPDSSYISRLCTHIPICFPTGPLASSSFLFDSLKNYL